MATMPTYAGLNFPLISLNKFAKLCLDSGTGLILPQLDPIGEAKTPGSPLKSRKKKPEKKVAPTKPVKKGTKKDEDKKSQESIVLEEEEIPRQFGLFMSDMTSHFNRCTEDQFSRLIPGEQYSNSLQKDICVDFHAFIHLIFKILLKQTQKDVFAETESQ